MSKKILFTVSDFYPKVGGAGEVVLRLAKRFARAGSNVSVATERVYGRSAKRSRGCPSNGVGVVEFEISGNKAKGYRGDKQEMQRYVNLIVRGGFDVIINYAAQTWHADLMMENIDKVPSATQKILVPCGYSALALHDPRYFLYFRWLPSVLKKYDHLVYLSSTYQDIEFHRKHGLKNEVFIPNGADEEEFLNPPQINIQEKYNVSTPYLAISVSNYFWLKGQDFVIRAFNKLPRDDITLVLIGAHQNKPYVRLLKFLARSNPNIKLLMNLPRAETVDFFKTADFFLFGSRLECSPLVMFESFASQTLFISRPVGNTAEYKPYNVAVNSPSKMSRALAKALDEPGWRKDKVNAAFRKYLTDHTYERLFAKYQGLT